MNIKELAKQADITYPTIRSFLNGKNGISLETFLKLVSPSDRKHLEAVIETTKNRIKRESGRRSVCL